MKRTMRVIAALAMVAGAWSFWTEARVSVADVQDLGDPAARLQVVVKRVHILDDRESFLSGEGEFRLFTTLEVCGGPNCTSDAPDSEVVVSAKDGYRFNGSTGDTLTLDHVFPDADALEFNFLDASEVGGYPIYKGPRFWLVFNMEELDNDFDPDDHMGAVKIELLPDHDWSRGTYTLRGVNEEIYEHPNNLGDYEIEFEIRDAQLPDLIPSIRERTLAGQQFYCVAVNNPRPTPSGPFQVAVRADETLIEAPTLAGVSAGGTTEHCVNRSDLPPQEHMLSFSVDEPRQVMEVHEDNNVYMWRVPAGGGGIAPQNVGTGVLVRDPSDSGTQKPDLTITSIRVNGKPASDRNACQEGKNDINVVVKNSGTAAATGFLVNLAYSLDDKKENNLRVPLGTLDAGKDVNIAFPDVELKKGDHSLTADADPDHNIDEANEDNNILKATVKCKDDE